MEDLKEHMDHYHSGYDDIGRAVGEGDYRVIVHNLDHSRGEGIMVPHSHPEPVEEEEVTPEEALARRVALAIDRQYGLYPGRMDYETVEEYLARAARHLGVPRGELLAHLELEVGNARTVTLYVTGTFHGLGDGALADRVYEAIEALGVIGVTLPEEEGED